MGLLAGILVLVGLIGIVLDFTFFPNSILQWTSVALILVGGILAFFGRKKKIAAQAVATTPARSQGNVRMVSQAASTPVAK